MKRTFISGLIIAAVLGVFALPMTTSAQKGGLYDYVMQDDTSCPVLQFNSRTGAYTYNDGERLLAGIGKVSITFQTMRLTFKNSGYYGVYTCDLKWKTGSGTLLEVNEGDVETTLTDSDMTNNTLECAPAAR